MVRRLRYAFVALCIGTGAVIACGPGFLDGISGGARADAGTTTKSDAASSDGGRCDHAGLPPRPAGNDDSSDAINLPTFAFDGVRVDTLPSSDAGPPAPAGLDLDNTCTCESQKDSCIRPGDAGPSCDGPDGRDNTFGILFNQLVVGIPLFPTTFATDRIRGGHFTILLDVLGWNGKPDDPNVQVTLRQSQKLDAQPLPDGGRQLPAFDGTDVWTVDPDSITGGTDAVGKDCRDPANAFACIGLIRDVSGYVANNELVASPRNPGSTTGPVTVTLRTAAGLIALPFHEFTIHGKISGTGPYHLDGEMTGSISAVDLNTMFGNLQDFTSSDPTKAICNNPPLFVTSKQGVCALRDLSLSGDTKVACDAISSAVSFGAGPANVGTVYQDSPLPSQCGGASFTCDE